MYVYNMAVCKGPSGDALSKDNVSIYTWNENEFKKNSSVCVSVVYNELCKLQLNEGISTVRLAADACGGQNKNTALLYMAAFWLQKNAPAHVKLVELLFPVRGHTFLPCDRVFGNLEKKLRLQERIYSPDEYWQFFEEHGTVKRPGVDWKVQNFKEVADASMKKPLPIKIMENKRFFIKKGRQNFPVIRAEPNYRNFINNFKIVTKKGKNFTATPAQIEPGVPLNAAKKTDIRKLLEVHSGQNWEEDARYNFIKSVLDDKVTTTNGDESDEEEECQCLVEEGCSETV